MTRIWTVVAAIVAAVGMLAACGDDTDPPVVAKAAHTTTAPAASTDAGSTVLALSPTAAACRNSVDPACGPFRFDPQPGVDSPMTVEVAVEPSSPTAGEDVVFHLTLRDPDGVSHGSSIFRFGDSAIGDSASLPCAKYGPWDPPARTSDPTTEVMDVRHTYLEAGAYTATFSFDAGPFDCADSVTGRGDRPYATSGEATVVVRVTDAAP